MKGVSVKFKLKVCGMEGNCNEDVKDGAFLMVWNMQMLQHIPAWPVCTRYICKDGGLEGCCAWTDVTGTNRCGGNKGWFFSGGPQWASSGCEVMI